MQGAALAKGIIHTISFSPSASASRSSSGIVGTVPPRLKASHCRLPHPSSACEFRLGPVQLFTPLTHDLAQFVPKPSRCIRLSGLRRRLA